MNVVLTYDIQLARVTRISTHFEAQTLMCVLEVIRTEIGNLHVIGRALSLDYEAPTPPF